MQGDGGISAMGWGRCRGVGDRAVVPITKTPPEEFLVRAAVCYFLRKDCVVSWMFRRSEMMALDTR